MLLLICNRELLFTGKRKDEDDMAKSTKTYEETGMPKRQMLSICQKEGYSVAELTDIQNELR